MNKIKLENKLEETQASVLYGRNSLLYVETIIGNAIKSKASDIHLSILDLNTSEKELQISYRVDGILVKAGLVAILVPDKGDRLIAGFDLTYYKATFGQGWPEKWRKKSPLTQDHHRGAQGRGFEPHLGTYFAFSLRNQR